MQYHDTSLQDEASVLESWGTHHGIQEDAGPLRSDTAAPLPPIQLQTFFESIVLIVKAIFPL